MPRWADLFSRPLWIGLAVVVIVLAAAVVLRILLREKPTPEELERQRRLAIHRDGKLGDGEVVDVDACLITYSYNVAGMEYTASQDVTDLQPALPARTMSLIGPVQIKFDPRNPANSIVLCEEWSGLRHSQP